MGTKSRLGFKTLEANPQNQPSQGQSFEAVCAERDRALQEANRWRRCYETEAHQRRIELAQVQARLQSLELEKKQLSEIVANLQGDESATSPAEPLPTDETTQHFIKENAKLKLALSKEKEAHLKTRATLINAIGDALNTANKKT